MPYNNIWIRCGIIEDSILAAAQIPSPEIKNSCKKVNLIVIQATSVLHNSMLEKTKKRRLKRDPLRQVDQYLNPKSLNTENSGLSEKNFEFMTNKIENVVSFRLEDAAQGWWDIV